MHVLVSVNLQKMYVFNSFMPLPANNFHLNFFFSCKALIKQVSLFSPKIKQAVRDNIQLSFIWGNRPSGVPARISARLSAWGAPLSCFASCAAQSLVSAACEAETVGVMACCISGGLVERLFGSGRAGLMVEHDQRGTWVTPSFSSSFR